MSPSKYRDRIYVAAVRLLEANGVTGDFTGDLDFYEAVDAVLEEMNEHDVDAGRFNRKAPRDTERQLAVIDRKLRQALGRQICRVCDTPIGYVPHPDGCSFCRSDREALAAVPAPAAPPKG